MAPHPDSSVIARLEEEGPLKRFWLVCKDLASVGSRDRLWRDVAQAGGDGGADHDQDGQATMMISDMEGKMDPFQYGNQRGISIQHYLIKMVQRILTVLDNNSRRDIFAVVASLIVGTTPSPGSAQH